MGTTMNASLQLEGGVASGKATDWQNSDYEAFLVELIELNSLSKVDTLVSKELDIFLNYGFCSKTSFRYSARCRSIASTLRILAAYPFEQRLWSDVCTTAIHWLHCTCYRRG